MEKEIKLQEDEFNEIIELREKIRENVEILGRLNIRKHFLSSDLKILDEEIAIALAQSEELNKDEKRVTDTVIEKYGEGKLDFSTGTYVRN